MNLPAVRIVIAFAAAIALLMTPPLVARSETLKPKPQRKGLTIDELAPEERNRDDQFYHLFTTKTRVIVQRSGIGEHPIAPNRGPGPWEAVEAFMKGNNSFVIDKGRERFLLTNNPNGFVERVC